MTGTMLPTQAHLGAEQGELASHGPPPLSGQALGEPWHDLTSSDSETLSLSALLALARRDDLDRWGSLSLAYTDPRGTPGLREVIARRHATLGADDVIVCAGAQEALSSVTRALLGQDDHAVVILPIYPPSERAVTSVCGATGVPLDRQQGWRLDMDRVVASLRPNTRLVVANFPNSPTGATLNRAELEGLIEICRRRGLWLVNDEIYRQSDLACDGPVPMLADVYERGISINGLSKGFGLPGLRVGWVACADGPLLTRVVAVKNALSTCVAATSEVLGIVALGAEVAILANTRAVGQRNRDHLDAILDRHPDVFEADQSRNLAFAFPRCRDPGGGDQVARVLAREAGIHLLPASLWASTLAVLPLDHVRIALGHRRNGHALAALAAHLSGLSGPAVRHGGDRPTQRWPGGAMIDQHAPSRTHAAPDGFGGNYFGAPDVIGSKPSR